MEKKTKILKDFCELVQFDNEQMIYVADATGISQERLHQLAEGAEPSVVELLAVCTAAAYHDFDESCRPGSARDIVKRWLEECYTKTFREINYLNELLEQIGISETCALLEKFHIFMDGSSLCAEGMAHLLERLLPDLKKLDRTMKICVPITVVNRLQSMASDENVAKLTAADVGMRNLIAIQNEDLMVVRGDENDTSILGTFISAFSKFKPTNSLLLLTNDKTMADAVEKLNTIGIEGDDILVARISDDGRPILWSATEAEAEQLPATEKELLSAKEEVPEQPVATELPVSEVIDDLGWIQLSDADDGQKHNGETILISSEAEQLPEVSAADVIDAELAVSEDDADILEALFGTPELIADDGFAVENGESIRIDEPVFADGEVITVNETSTEDGGDMLDEDVLLSDQKIDIPDDPTTLFDAGTFRQAEEADEVAEEDIAIEDATLLADVMQMVFDNPHSEEETDAVLDDKGFEQLMNISFLLNSDIDEEEIDSSDDEEDYPESMTDLPMDLDELIMKFAPDWTPDSSDDEEEATYKYDVT